MSSDRQPVRFGVFEVNLETGEVRRAGVKVRMQEQPFQVLAALLEKPGEIVTKEELQERIWKDDTFVDFDRSLATAINKVRQALGDSATRPRFIETVPKRGYRFVGLGEEPSAAEPEPAGSRRPWVLGAAVAAILAGSAAWYFSSREETVKWGDPVRITADAGLTFQPTISPEGTLLAYSSDKDGQGNLDIYVQQIGGGGLVRLTDDPADDTAPDFSPDGKSVVFRSERGEGGVYVVPALGGSEPRPLAPNGHRPRYSPDGKWIAYHTGARGASSIISSLPVGELYVLPTGGGSPRPLRTAALYESSPVWSPDSSSLLVRTTQSAFGGPGFQDWRIVSLDGADRGPTGAFAEIERSAAAMESVSYIPIPDSWGPDGFVYFSSRDADSTNLWRIQVSPELGRVVGAPQSVLPGPGSFRGASLANAGRIVFAHIEESEDIWSLSIDADEGVVRAVGRPDRLMTSGAAEGGADLSRDGDIMLFWTGRSGALERWAYDFAAKRERLVGPWLGYSALNFAGTLFAESRDPRLTIQTLDGIVNKAIAYPGGAVAWGWSPDDSLLLMGRLKDRHRPIFLLDLDSGKETELLSDPNKSFFQGQFSPDGRWITWMTVEDGVQAAPFRGSEAIPESERIQISELGAWADKPRWSPNGDLLYHTSDRDGFVCIYAQPLDPETKRPQGDLLDVYHSHPARVSLGNVGMLRLAIDVAPDKVVFSMAELKGNIWMTDPVKSE